MTEFYRTWKSAHLNREFEMLVFGHAGIPVILFPTSMGRYFETKDCGLIAAAAGPIEAGMIKVFAPDSIDEESWFNNDIEPGERVRRHLAYDAAILHEVIPFACGETGYNRVVVSGCSMGAYHAVNFAFRHPETVSHIISMSGAFDIKQFIEGYYDDNCYFNNPPDYIPNIGPSPYLNDIRRMHIILGTGEWDSCLENTQEFSHLLHAKGIDHWLDVQWSGEHDWPLWRRVFPAYLTKVLSNGKAA